MPFGLRMPELIIILVIFLLLFGARRLPEMARSVGQSVREFRKGIKEMKDDIDGDEPDAKKKAGVSTASAESAPAAEPVAKPPARTPAEPSAETEKQTA